MRSEGNQGQRRVCEQHYKKLYVLVRKRARERVIEKGDNVKLLWIITHLSY